jgi:membrane-bound lytic murein transglycosylase MltF
MAGRGDVATERLTITPQRRAQVDFSAPIRSNVAEIVVTRKGGPKRKASLDAFIADAKRGQGLLNQLERRSFVDNRWVKRARSPAAASKFLQLLGLFVTSAGEFDLEWVALLSRGYQEPGLDHAVKSRVGAVGVMQLMPTTAAAAPISMPEIHRPGVNVRADAKYMRYLMETYFAEPGLPPAERLRFALAAYSERPPAPARPGVAGECGAEQAHGEQRQVVDDEGARGDADVLRHDARQRQHQARGPDDHDALDEVPVIGRQVEQAEDQRRDQPCHDDGTLAPHRPACGEPVQLGEERQQRDHRFAEQLR